MSAPEPQVRMYTREWKGRTEYGWTCDGCGWFPYAFWTLDSAPPPSVELHNTNCRELALARLQARWDARDKALRTLIERWRGEADEIARNRSNAAIAAAIRADADELERAIGDGRG